MFDRLFPLWRNRNIGLFYLLNVVIHVWIMGGVWVFIWGRFMTNQEIGISDAITFAVGMLLELPSGVLADLMGRKRAIIFGHIFMVLGNLMIAFSASFAGITWWYLIWTIGYAFQSGTTEAVAYDSLSKEQQARDWPRIISRASIINKAAYIAGPAVGGLLFAVQFNLPYLAAAGFGALGIIAALALRVPKMTHKHNLRELATYANQIRDGVGVLLRRAVWPIALAAITVVSVSFLYNWGLLRPLTAERFGFTEVTVPLLQSLGALCTVIALVKLPWLQKRLGAERLIVTACLVYGAMFALFFLPLNWVAGGVAITLVAIVAAYAEQLFSVFINAHTKAEHRATTLSAVSLLTRLPYVLLAIFIGILADAQALNWFVLVTGLVILTVGGFVILARKKLDKIIA